MSRCTLIALGLCFSLFSLAGDIEKLSIDYTYESNDPHESPDQAQHTAIQRAKAKAMEERFGLDVSSVNSIVQRSRTEDDEASSVTDVFALRETSVRGEWIETTEERILETTYRDGFWRVRVFVSGTARNHSTPKAGIRYALIRDLAEVDNRDQFADDDPLYLRFSSPVSGSLCVYLVDENQDVFCLLPYMAATSGCQTIRANRDYLFFHPSDARNADEYSLTAERSVEQNAVYIIFTPRPLIKAGDRKGGSNWRKQPMPRQLTYREFTAWLSRNQTQDPDMVVKTEVITIRRK